MAALFAIGWIIAYALVGAVIGGKALAWRQRIHGRKMVAKRADERRRYPNIYRDVPDSEIAAYVGDMPELVAVVVGLVWPISVFGLLAVGIAMRDTTKYAQREADLAERERLLEVGMAELRKEGLA